MRAITLASLFGFSFSLTLPCFAHGRHDHGIAVFGWTWDPWITAPLAIVALLFVLGWMRLIKRSTSPTSSLRRRGLLFAAGWLMLALALTSPLHKAGEHSFVLHMMEHEILMLGATPLLVLAEPRPIFLWSFSRRYRRVLGHWGAAMAGARLWRWMFQPLGATVLQGAALWLWHAPTLFNRAVLNDGWHATQHLSFVITSMLFWTAVLGRRGARRSGHGNGALAAICLFVTSLIGGALGALMALSESPWYSAYCTLGTTLFGLSPAEDQQLAGLVMWLPGGLVHAMAALVIAGSLLKSVSVQREIRDVS